MRTETSLHDRGELSIVSGIVDVVMVPAPDPPLPAVPSEARAADGLEVSQAANVRCLVPCRRSSVRPSLWASGRRRPRPVGDWRHATWNGFETESSENLLVIFVMTKGMLQAHRETPAELLRVANSQQAEYHPTRASCRYTRTSGWHANPPTKHLVERTRQIYTIQRDVRASLRGVCVSAAASPAAFLANG
jgi:hypothetical protein